MVLISRFRDQEALEAHHDHPLHVAVKDFIDGIRERSTVVDFPGWDLDARARDAEKRAAVSGR